MNGNIRPKGMGKRAVSSGKSHSDVETRAKMNH